MNFLQRIYSTAYVERYVKDNYDGTNIREVARKLIIRKEGLEIKKQ